MKMFKRKRGSPAWRPPAFMRRRRGKAGGARPVSTHFPQRRYFVLGVLAVMAGGLAWRAVDLQILDKDFLRDKGDKVAIRSLPLPAHRGMITDRRGEPLAVSTPVDSVWANPEDLLAARAQWPALARLLNLDVNQMAQRLEQSRGREFVYLRRHQTPALGQQVKALKIPGVASQREYRRYYPAGEVTGHLLGFTNVDDAGQVGLESAYNATLRGVPGEMRVLRDRKGHVVESVENIRIPVPGGDLALSIDKNMQYLAYRELKAAVQRERATSGSAVILDVRTGEVLAMVNQPAYNPNNRATFQEKYYRNRAVTEVFEPGSTIKPFTVAAALQAGTYRPETLIETGPGWMTLGPNTIRDVHDYGLIDVATVIKKSSNVGVAKMALSLPSGRLWHSVSDVGFGTSTGSGFPGEVPGRLPDPRRWYPIDRASFAFGYGLSVSTLQLTSAYATLANGGMRLPVSLTPVEKAPAGERVMDPKVARQMLGMLETVVRDDGTGTAARVPGYRVAGKTGTVRRMGSDGYLEDSYIALFAGVAPVSGPRFAMVVMINDPRRDEYYGGQVAAPVFARVMNDALRLGDIPPDDLAALQAKAAGKTGDVGPL